MADWTIKDGDSAPAFDDTLTLDDGTALPLTGATLQLVVRSLTSAQPLTLTGTPEIINATTGQIRYTPTTADTTDRTGEYMAAWHVTLASGTIMTFPTVGYLTVTIEENLTTAAQQLVSVPEAKQYLAISAGDRTHDAALARYIRAARPTIENICGPIIPTVYDEWHHGGSPTLQVRRRPSTAPGTTPILELLTASEYTGSTLHDLDIISTPTDGSSYSCTIDQIGTITRRTPFAQDVHITYRAGQDTTPANVHAGTLELLRANWQTTRPVGNGRMTVADDMDTNAPLHFYVPRKVLEMLAPPRRAPALA